MASVISDEPRTNLGQPDELDRLLDYDNAVDDFLRDIPVGNDGQSNALQNGQSRDEDEEVQVKRKRRPIPKLDENRLLSEAGIPKLRKITKTRLKFKGKGHEFADISRLLTTYQLWLDDLYPRAKFRDGLAMVEKVGHSKRMQIMRRAWLDETKPFRRGVSPNGDLSDGNNEGTRQDGNVDARRDEAEDPLFENVGDGNGHVENHGGRRDSDAPQEDELSALLAENNTATAKATEVAQDRRRGPFEEDDEPDEDELDALLENDEFSGPVGNIGLGVRPLQADPNDNGVDMNPSRPRSLSRTPTTNEKQMDDFADDEEAMASMGVW